MTTQPNPIAIAGKAGEDWTWHELRALKVRVEEQAFEEFFGLASPPDLPSSVQSFSQIEERTLVPDEATYKLLHYLDLAHRQENSVDAFAARLLEAMGYGAGHRLVLTRQELPLIHAGMRTNATADVCVIDDENDILLLVLADQRLDHIKDDLEPQVVSTAVAAFQRNNLLRKTELAMAELPSIIFPIIVLRGTAPSFYRVRISSELNAAVIGGFSPEAATVISRHTPRLPQRRSYGMKPLDSRQHLLRCFQAFKLLYERLLL